VLIMTQADFRIAHLLAVASLAVAGCGSGGGIWPFKGSGAGAADSYRVPAGATEYTCATGKRLVLRHAADAKSVWVIYPDREFRLDRVAAGP
jgi:hypothetical protein